MTLHMRVPVLIVAVASSYLTLGLFASSKAAALWAPYALVMFVLAISNLRLQRTRHRARSPIQR